MSELKGTRIFGLDLIRSFAILVVVYLHSYVLIENYFPADFSFFPMPDPVDLFFVLSGYLVGMIIIRTAEKQGNFNFATAIVFLKRRWFRSLPNYFLFLIINAILIYFGLISGTLNKYFVTYLAFFQNFHKPYDFLYWETWSLSVEEWFYLLFPLIIVGLGLFVSVIKFRFKEKMLFATIAFIIFPLLYRISQSSLDLDRELFLRKLVLTRLDTIGFGILAAWFHFYYDVIWLRFKKQLFALGIALLALFLSIEWQNGFFYKTFFLHL